MLRHRGKKRTFLHNIRLAAILSFVAGMVNICGLLGMKTLTTNVTGHFAFFAEELVLAEYSAALLFLLSILAFLAGAFTASLLSGFVMLRKPEHAHILPMVIETVILFWVGLQNEGQPDAAFLAILLLFAMGIQNSLVTTVSSAVVRTTHLTGLFTDLGIELSQLILYRSPDDVRKLRRSIFLRTCIIMCFFAGGIAGGFLYMDRGLQALHLAMALVIVALVYDNIRYRLFSLRRKIRK